MNEIGFLRRFYEILTICPWTWWEMNEVGYDMVQRSYQNQISKSQS